MRGRALADAAIRRLGAGSSIRERVGRSAVLTTGFLAGSLTSLGAAAPLLPFAEALPAALLAAVLVVDFEPEDLEAVPLDVEDLEFEGLETMEREG
jgi:hypothetical protein